MSPILILENDQVLSMDMAKILENAGYQVVTASDAAAGMTRLQHGRIELVIAAQEILVSGGAEICSRIRQAAYIPIIALGTEESGAETLDLGADAYLTSPPDARELIARIRRMLRRKSGDLRAS